MHPFDQAIALTPLGGDRFAGQTTAAYENMVGPFGGITAAVLLNAVMQHPQLLGEPTALTINFAGPVPDGPFEILARPVRTNRSTQHWVVEQWVTENGAPAVASTATVLTAVRRETWSATDLQAPLTGGPQPGEQAVVIDHFTPWLKQYTMVPLQGHFPTEWHGGEAPDSLTRMWVRKTTPRTLDACALAAVCDIFYPRVWMRRAQQVPAGTVSMTAYIHASLAEIAATGEDYVLAQAVGHTYRNNYADQSGAIWRKDGLLLASTQQIVYYKE